MNVSCTQRGTLWVPASQGPATLRLTPQSPSEDSGGSGPGHQDFFALRPILARIQVEKFGDFPLSRGSSPLETGVGPG